MVLHEDRVVKEHCLKKVVYASAVTSVGGASNGVKIISCPIPAYTIGFGGKLKYKLIAKVTTAGTGEVIAYHAGLATADSAATLVADASWTTAGNIGANELHLIKGEVVATAADAVWNEWTGVLDSVATGAAATGSYTTTSDGYLVISVSSTTADHGITPQYFEVVHVVESNDV